MLLETKYLFGGKGPVPSKTTEMQPPPLKWNPGYETGLTDTPVYLSIIFSYIVV